MSFAGIDPRRSGITVEAALDAMLVDKKLQRRSPETIATYERNITAFIRFYGAGKPVAGITPEVIKAYAASIIERNVTDDTYAHYLRELKVFVRWCAAEKHLPEAPKVLLPTLHAKDRLNLVSEADYEALLRAMEGKTVWSLRDQAFLGLLYDSGARISEILNLDVDDVTLEAGEARVMGKGKKGRTIFYSEETANRLAKYRRRLEVVADPEAYFVSRSAIRLRDDAARAILDRAKKRSGVTCDVNPHNFRHTFATRFLRNGGNAIHLKRLLGHTTLKMTDWYVSLLTEDIKEAHAEFSRQPSGKRPRAPWMPRRGRW